MKISDEQRRARLAERHRLLPRTRTDDLARIADDLVALHSTDPVTVYLSAMARMAHPSIAAVEQALYTDRTLIRHHAMRRTLWLATPEVARMIHAAATRKLVAPERARLVKALVASGIDDPDAWLHDARRQVLDYLDRNGPTPARDVGRQVPALRRPLTLGSGRWVTTLSAHTRVLLLLGFEGEVLRGPPLGSWVSGAYAYASARSWLPGGLGDLEELPAATELVRRWLRGFGPGTTTDVAWWFGWTKSLTRRALEACGRRRGRAGRRAGLGGGRRPAGTRARAVGGGAAGPGSDHDGLEATRLVSTGRRRVRPSTASATAARPSGWTAGSLVPGRRRRTA